MKKDGGENKEATGGENKDATKEASDKSAETPEQEAEREALEARVKELEADNEGLRADMEKAKAYIARLEQRDAERGLKVNTLRDEGHQGSLVKPGKRLYLNAKKNRLVPEGHKDAATLYCTANSRVPRAEFERLRG